MEILNEKLQKIHNIFDVDKIINQKLSIEDVKKYYLINRLSYSIFHSSSGLIHMGISRDGIFKKEDLLEPAKTVEKYLTSSTQKVLELATGRGGNSEYLARRHQGIEFFGVDVSEGQLRFAFKKAKKIKNYYPEYGDHHDLSKYNNEEFDVVFEVEALCHSDNPEIVLKEAYRVLSPGGFFIVFDGYRNKKDEDLNNDEKIARDLIEKTMAVNNFKFYQDFLSQAVSCGFKIEKEEDVSEYVIPTMNRFEKLSRQFFKYKIFSILVSKIFPKEFTQNSIAGFLMPEIMRRKVFCYQVLILRK